MPPDDVLVALRQAWTALAQLNVPLAVMGGLAMGAWKRPRFTKDVDLLVAVGDPMSQAVVKQLRTAGFRSERPDPVVRLQDDRFIQVIYESPAAMVDVRLDVLLATTPLHEQALARRVPLPASELGFELAVVSCEDLILLKLVAGRVLDRVDVAELLKANRETLDTPYLVGWLGQLRLKRPFRDAWLDAFPGERAPV
jgi:hypothetical protein